MAGKQHAFAIEPTREGPQGLRLLPILNEMQARLYLAEKALGHGAISELAKLTGVSRTTITKGIKELQSGIGLEQATSIRKGGGGRKRVEKVEPTLLKELESDHGREHGGGSDELSQMDGEVGTEDLR